MGEPGAAEAIGREIAGGSKNFSGAVLNSVSVFLSRFPSQDERS